MADEKDKKDKAEKDKADKEKAEKAEREKDKQTANADAEKDKATEEERKREEAESLPQTPDPGPRQPLQREPAPPRLTEEQMEEERERVAQEEEDARQRAADRPEDPSVEAKARQPIMVNREAFEREWEARKSAFPGVEPEFGKEKDGMVELTNIQAPSMAYATSTVEPTQVEVDRNRTQHGWADFVDNTRPDEPVLPRNRGAEDDLDVDEIEATPKNRQAKEKARS
jgi:hypothetical protein